MFDAPVACKRRAEVSLLSGVHHDQYNDTARHLQRSSTVSIPKNSVAVGSSAPRNALFACIPRSVALIIEMRALSCIAAIIQSPMERSRMHVIGVARSDQAIVAATGVSACHLWHLVDKQVRHQMRNPACKRGIQGATCGSLWANTEGTQSTQTYLQFATRSVASRCHLWHLMENQ